VKTLNNKVLLYILVAGEDYKLSTSLLFNVTAGSTPFSVDIINDMIQEDNETFNIAIRLLTPLISLSLGISSSIVTILDDDGMYLSLILIDNYLSAWLFSFSANDRFYLINV